MYKKSFLQPILLGLITILFASCDKDFNELGTDIVGDNHFGFDVDTLSTVKAYNQKLGPIASNNLPINPLGFYDNPAFGKTEANFVTQVELSSTSPVFNNTNPTLYEQLPVIDSVILDVPYFNTLKKTNDDGSNEYRLDSIYGVSESKFKLKVFQSNYYLRDLDPGQSLGELQSFYTDENSMINDNRVDVQLNNAPQTAAANNADGHENENFFFDKREHKLTTLKDDGVTPVYTRYAPSMRLHLRTDVFYNKILNAPSGSLTSQAAFKNYFRGIYFKVEENGNPGAMAMLNFKGGKITIFYREDKITPDNPDTTVNEYKREQPSKTFALNMTGSCVSLQKNTDNPDYLLAANSTQEASKLYLKGGQGSMSVIDLFGSVDTKGYVLNSAFNENLPISATNPKYILVPGPNGISDEIDDIKFNGWLINEANLTFYVDRVAMKSDDPDPVIKSKVVEPNRIYLYDLTHKKALVDYSYDITTNGAYPKFNKVIYGGYLSNEDGTLVKQIKNDDGLITAKGKKYKIRITNYVRNLIQHDSVNVRLGLSVTESISNVGLSKLRTANSNTSSAPTMSVLSPTGTILYGTGPTTPNLPEGKKLKLEIYYTKP